MIDPRLKQLSYNLINYSCRLKAGERVIIEVIGRHDDLLCQLIEEAYVVGAIPFVWSTTNRQQRQLLLGATREQLEIMAQQDAELMKKADAYIGVRGDDNASELSDVPAGQMELYDKYYDDEVHGKIRVPHTKWVVLRYPSPAMAQLAGMSTSAFEDYFFNVCNLDYGKMSKAMDALVQVMQRTDRVRLTGKDTDLTFSIKGIPAIKCDGLLNIPDGEIFTAPVKTSVNGTISFNTPSIYAGQTFENIRLTFKDGRIIECSGSDTERMERIFNTDEGARYVGEFAIGVNPYITRPMKDTLFDEKIAGSIHFTPGACYDEAPNGNSSAIHWDLVLIQTPEYGGGDIWFDDVLIRRDGKFVLPELEVLNPENLL